MSSSIAIFGHGPGISDAVARRFGREGHAVAIVARSAPRLADAAAALRADGIDAHAFVADLADLAQVGAVVARMRAALGPVGIVHWNAFSQAQGHLLQAAPCELGYALNLRVTSFVAAVQACLDDLVHHRGAVLATSGVMALAARQIDALSIDYGSIAISAAAQRKACAILAEALRPSNVFVGEVIVNGFVKGSEGAQGKAASLEPADIAQAFWQLYSERSVNAVVWGGAVRWAGRIPA